MSTRSFYLVEFEKWYRTIRRNELSSIITKRLLSAISEREDYADSFVDALIVLESLFGVQAEVSFQISTAVSFLLCPDDLKERKGIFYKMKRFYKIRSDIVHGRDIAKHNLYEELQTIGSLVLKTVRVLLGARSDLLKIAPNKRINAIIFE